VWKDAWGEPMQGILVGTVTYEDVYLFPFLYTFVSTEAFQT